MFRTAAAIVLMSLAATGWAQTPNPKVLIKTNQGDITVELDAAKAPKSVENFVAYV